MCRTRSEALKSDKLNNRATPFVFQTATVVVERGLRYDSKLSHRLMSEVVLVMQLIADPFDWDKLLGKIQEPPQIFSYVRPQKQVGQQAPPQGVAKSSNSTVDAAAILQTVLQTISSVLGSEVSPLSQSCHCWGRSTAEGVDVRGDLAVCLPSQLQLHSSDTFARNVQAIDSPFLFFSGHNNRSISSSCNH